MALVYVRRKSDWQQTIVSTQDPRRDEDYVGLAYQQLGKHKGKPRLWPAEWQEPQPQQQEDLQALYAQFEAKEGRKVPNIKKNDIGWIKSKLV